MIYLVLWLLAGPAVADDAERPPAPTPPAVVVTDDDVRALHADNDRQALERSIRRDVERAQHWADDSDD